MFLQRFAFPSFTLEDTIFYLSSKLGIRCPFDPEYTWNRFSNINIQKDQKMEIIGTSVLG